MDVNNVYGHPAVTVPQALPVPKTSVQTQVVTSVSKNWSTRTASCQRTSLCYNNI